MLFFISEERGITEQTKNENPLAFPFTQKTLTRSSGGWP